jgi:hypothetical protein
MIRDAVKKAAHKDTPKVGSFKPAANGAATAAEAPAAGESK